MRSALVRSAPGRHGPEGTSGPVRARNLDAPFRLLVLASSAQQCIGVDTASGAFVRVAHAPDVSPAAFEPTLEPFDLAETTLLDSVGQIPEEPELVCAAGPLERVGSVRAKAAERWLRPLFHPTDHPLLGFPGPSCAFWTRDGTHPSVTLVIPQSEPVITVTDSGARCRFFWRGMSENLPVEDTRLIQRLRRSAWHPSGAVHLLDALGFRPRRVIVALTEPREGYCRKVCAGFLPAG